MEENKSIRDIERENILSYFSESNKIEVPDEFIDMIIDYSITLRKEIIESNLQNLTYKSRELMDMFKTNCITEENFRKENRRLIDDRNKLHSLLVSYNDDIINRGKK